jgi:hypothetical protein
MKLPRVAQHHGSCDLCGERHVLVIHLGYDVQPNRDFRICKECFAAVAFGDERLYGVEQ